MEKYFKLLIFFILFLFFTNNSYAYIDPGSTNIILTVIISFFVSIWLFFKQTLIIIKDKINSFLTKIINKIK